jgi:hypothetical protein
VEEYHDNIQKSQDLQRNHPMKDITQLTLF